MTKLSKPASIISTIKPDKTETYAGKHTVWVTKSYKQEDGSVVLLTEKRGKSNCRLVAEKAKNDRKLCKEISFGFFDKTYHTGGGFLTA